MPRALVSFTAGEGAVLAAAGALVVAVAVVGFRVWKRSRISPEERERRRRAGLVAQGKMGDARLVEVRENLLFYSYDVRGIEYTASQDLGSLKEYMPEQLSPDGNMYVKYDARNPANSIVLAENWSGLRAGSARLQL
jgi:hypothetical protein